MPEILIYGLQRSGTNFLETVMRRALKVDFANNYQDRQSARHKHARLYDDKSLVPTSAYVNQYAIESVSDLDSLIGGKLGGIVVISKDPYSWYLSYLRWSRKCQWPDVNHHYIEEYNEFYRFWLGMAQAHSDMAYAFVRYIDLLADPDEQVRILSRVFSIPAKRYLLGKRLRPRWVPHSESFGSDGVRYYLGREYLDEMSDAQIESVNARLDRDIAERLGYEVLRS